MGRSLQTLIENYLWCNSTRAMVKANYQIYEYIYNLKSGHQFAPEERISFCLSH